MKSPQRFWRYQQCIPGPFLIIELLHIEEAALHLAKIHMLSSFLHDSLQNYCDSICTVRWWHTPRNEFRGFLGSAGYRRLCYQQQLHQADVLHCLLQWTMPRPRVYKSYAMDVPYRVKRPWFKMLTDALKSLRCWMPLDGQTQSRILRERSSFKKPQLEHRWYRPGTFDGLPGSSPRNLQIRQTDNTFQRRTTKKDLTRSYGQAFFFRLLIYY